MLTTTQKQELVSALMSHGYNRIDAVNVSKSSSAERLYKEYIQFDLDKFITAHIGRPIDIDGKFGNQCMDLMRAYCVEVLKIGAYTLPAVSYAYQVFRNFPDAGNRYFSKVYNNPKDLSQVPPEGAILFWKPRVIGITGVGGHVAVNKKSDSYKLLSFDQNWPTGTFCHLQSHSYRGLWGWFVPKKA